MEIARTIAGLQPDALHLLCDPIGGAFTGCLVDDLPTLIWVQNLAALELHTHQARAEDQLHPTAVVIDLDPGAPATIVDCCRVALELRATLERLGLDAVVKTSGSKGLHLSVPLNNGATWALSRSGAYQSSSSQLAMMLPRASSQARLRLAPMCSRFSSQT